MEIDNLFGLPAHPLLVHLPLVLVPVSAVFAIIALVVRRHRRRLVWCAALLSGVALVSAQLAIASGEALDARVKRTDLVRRHTAAGDNVRIFAFILFVALLVLAVLPRSRWGGAGARRQHVATVAACFAVAAAAVASVVTIVVVGHSGAKAVWNDTPDTYTEGQP